MATVDRSFIGKGSSYLVDRAGTGGYFPLGNVSAMTISFEEETKSVKDYQNAGGGNANTLTSITGMQGSLTTVDYSSSNLAKFLRGTETMQAAASIADEAHAVAGLSGEFVPFDRIRAIASAFSVTLDDGTTPCVEGTDFEQGNNGIIVLAGGNIIGEAGVELTYEAADAEVLNALTESGKEWGLYFDGLNEAQNSSLIALEMFRIKFSPAQDIGFIGDEFSEMSADFEVLSDGTKSGAGISKFMKVMQIAPA